MYKKSKSALFTTSDAVAQLKDDFKAARKRAKHSRDEAALRTSVPSPTIRKFEMTGQISLRQFLLLAEVYGDIAAICAASFPIPVAKSMDELLRSQESKP